MRLVDNGHQLMWNGPPADKLSQPEVGDLMAVSNHKQCVTLYKINKVLDPVRQLDSWPEGWFMNDRCVVYLDSDSSKVVGWDDWISLGGPSKPRGTIVVRTSNRILDFWR
jgi:hypothetical protein